MATVFNVHGRLPYLLTHGLVHLMGYDHEHDDEWRRMIQKEDEVLSILAQEFPDTILPPSPSPPTSLPL